MSRVYVAFLLDLFQPSTQRYEVVEQISRECYRALVNTFNTHNNARFTLSLSNSLASLLVEYGFADVLDGIREGIETGVLEITHTGAHHPVFPLLPEREVKRQIECDIAFKETQFGDIPRRGIWSPEMCYHDMLVPLYRQMRFLWTAMDDRLVSSLGMQIPRSAILCVGNFGVLMRSSLWSEKVRQGIKGSDFVEWLECETREQDCDTYKIISLSGETFGHHVKYYEETFVRDMLFSLKKTDYVRLCTVSDLVDIFPHIEQPATEGREFRFFPPLSWATLPENFLRGDPYPHWKSAGNPIHEGLWELTNLIIDASGGLNFDSGSHVRLRSLLDRAFYSSQYYWASVWFWNPRLVCVGVDHQMRALYQCAELTNNRQLLDDGSRVYTRLIREIEIEARRRQRE